MNRATSSLLCLTAACLVTISPLQSRAQAAPMGQMAEHAHSQAVPSTSLTVTVDGKATTLSLADLHAMTQKSVTVHNPHSKLDETYSGVPLGDLLAKYGLPVDKSTHRTMLRSYIVAEGTDKYWVLYSVTEVEASEHTGDVIVATSVDGKPLGDDGQLKLVGTADKKPQRWVRNLASITVKNAD